MPRKSDNCGEPVEVTYSCWVVAYWKKDDAETKRHPIIEVYDREVEARWRITTITHTGQIEAVCWEL